MEARKLATQEKNNEGVTKESLRRRIKKWKQEIAYPRKRKKAWRARNRGTRRWTT